MPKRNREEDTKEKFIEDCHHFTKSDYQVFNLMIRENLSQYLSIDEKMLDLSSIDTFLTYVKVISLTELRILYNKYF